MNPTVFEQDEDAYQMLNPDDVRVPVYEGNIAQPIMDTDEDQWIKETCVKHGKGRDMGIQEFKQACYDLGHFGVTEAVFKEEVTLSGTVDAETFSDWFKLTEAFRKFEELEKTSQKAFKETIEYFRKYDSHLAGQIPEAEFRKFFEDLSKTSEYGIVERALPDILARSPTGSASISFDFVFYNFIALTAESNTQCKYKSERGVCTNVSMIMGLCVLHHCSKCQNQKQSNLTFCAGCGGEAEKDRVEAGSAAECAYKSANGHCNTAHVGGSKFCKHHKCPGSCGGQKSSRADTCGKC
jgi:hypothetical protein